MLQSKDKDGETMANGALTATCQTMFCCKGSRRPNSSLPGSNVPQKTADLLPGLQNTDCLWLCATKLNSFCGSRPEPWSSQNLINSSDNAKQAMDCEAVNNCWLFLSGQKLGQTQRLCWISNISFDRSLTISNTIGTISLQSFEITKQAKPLTENFQSLFIGMNIHRLMQEHHPLIALEMLLFQEQF